MDRTDGRGRVVWDSEKMGGGLPECKDYGRMNLDASQRPEWNRLCKMNSGKAEAEQQRDSDERRARIQVVQSLHGGVGREPVDQAEAAAQQHKRRAEEKAQRSWEAGAGSREASRAKRHPAPQSPGGDLQGTGDGAVTWGGIDAEWGGGDN